LQEAGHAKACTKIELSNEPVKRLILVKFQLKNKNKAIAQEQYTIAFIGVSDDTLTFTSKVAIFPIGDAKESGGTVNQRGPLSVI